MIGSDNLYYATFALVLIAAATVIALVLRRRGSVGDGLLVLALVVGTLAANLAPSLDLPSRARRQSGGRALGGGGRVEQRGIGAAAGEPGPARPRQPHRSAAPPSPLATTTRSRPATARPATRASGRRHGRLRLAGRVRCWDAPRRGVGAVAGLAGTRERRRGDRAGGRRVGGLGALLELFVTPDIRAWNRISVVIAFLSLLAAARCWTRSSRAGAGRRWGAALVRLAAGGRAVFGVYDQTSDAYIPAYSATARQWRSDSVFVAAIEARLPLGASVFQLPYVPFPEGYPQTPVGGPLATYATKYEPLRGYLHSSTLRWSYGAMKGRSADWAAQLAGQPLSLVTAAAAAAGFDGVWVDPAAFDPANAAGCARRCARCSACSRWSAPTGTSGSSTCALPREA